ncbi:MAG: DUF2026 family protein, partial [Martelella sp.]|uniref:DUF2026 family protein n=1 Tax=Martelella sp. TaxID=1969699 RepID=UPI003241F67E
LHTERSEKRTLSIHCETHSHLEMGFTSQEAPAAATCLSAAAYEDEAPTPDGLTHQGALFTNPNPSLTDALLEPFLNRNDVNDLIQIADVWYSKRRGKLKPTLEMIDNRGQRQPLYLPRDMPTGSW